MLSKKQILDNFQVEEIIKEYPKSGQKRVLLIRHPDFGDIVDVNRSALQRLNRNRGFQLQREWE